MSYIQISPFLLENVQYLVPTVKQQISALKGRRKMSILNRRRGTAGMGADNSQGKLVAWAVAALVECDKW